MLRIYSDILSVITEVDPLIETIARRNSALADQLSRALDSVLQNVAEGSGSQGRNRRARYFNALGSQTETRACLDIAVARRFIKPISPELHKKLDGITAVLWTVTH